MANVKFEQRGSLGLITLNRISALNALTLEMINQITEYLFAWREDEHIKAVVIQSASEKAFCAGGDVRFLYEMGKQHHTKEWRSFFSQEYRMNYLIHHYPKPYIALMHGVTMGGGVGVALHGSHPVASEHFSFAMPETSIGFFPDIGASFLLNRCPEFIGLYLGLSGQRLDAGSALYCGLVKYTVPHAYFPELIEDLAEHLSHSEDVYAQVDHCIARYSLPLTAEALTSHLPAINFCFSCENIEQIIASLKGMKEEWCEQLSQQLQKRSPISLKVTLEQLQRARSLSLAECLQMDYGLAQHFLADHDFYEGVRALLIDKDKNPHWQPAALAEVSDERVQRYFSISADFHQARLNLLASC